jgi:methionyl-tRNA formyltransferase
VDDAEWIRTYPDEVDGLWNELPAETVDEIRDSCDIVFRRGFGLIRGDVLEAAEQGVLSYHHGDPRKYRGGPAGFWEFMHDEPTAGMMVQSLRAELDAGVVQAYAEVDIDDCRSWGATRRRLYENSTHLLSEAVRTVQSPDRDPTEITDLGPVHHPPSALELLRYASKYVRRNYT